MHTIINYNRCNPPIFSFIYIIQAIPIYRLPSTRISINRTLLQQKKKDRKNYRLEIRVEINMAPLKVNVYEGDETSIKCI